MCKRPDGSIYGTAGQCRKGVEVNPSEVKKPKKKVKQKTKSISELFLELKSKTDKAFQIRQKLGNELRETKSRIEALEKDLGKTSTDPRSKKDLLRLLDKENKRKEKLDKLYSESVTRSNAIREQYWKVLAELRDNPPKKKATGPLGSNVVNFTSNGFRGKDLDTVLSRFSQGDDESAKNIRALTDYLVKNKVKITTHGAPPPKEEELKKLTEMSKDSSFMRSLTVDRYEAFARKDGQSYSNIQKDIDSFEILGNKKANEKEKLEATKWLQQRYLGKEGAGGYYYFGRNSFALRLEKGFLSEGLMLVKPDELKSFVKSGLTSNTDIHSVLGKHIKGTDGRLKVKYSNDEIDAVINLIHEAGHLIHYNGAKDKGVYQYGLFESPPKKVLQEKPVSEYAQKNFKEWFAEAFVAYNLAPQELRETRPETYNWIKETFERAQEEAYQNKY